ncbi:hypothetical protein GCM10007160_17500 [Litchfieldella qijiaojingensis]|uniref:DUF4202 domain-containing protein n=1 Tax=Litchfieldella qijiaojingensis TaxID=980347 RepID=A0ABQ2YNX2_9GAMM|nr:DUF4202 domain-containing protein [Halomonas qijiaojingensis]GGX90534.1 hypothetical protein GCM10007160_17500 [Halomonas qijiaojingensis]
MPDASRFQAAIERLDGLHREDPRLVEVEGQRIPYEQLYARRMSEWLERVAPQASEALRLAVRAQHLQRWRIPRDDYSRDRAGYLAWRRDLGRRQAEQAAEVLADVGYDEATCERVAALIRKENLRRDAETQALEDVACLVFLQYYFADFAKEHDEAKLLRIVRKTWNKMSARGHELAETITLAPAHKALVQRALA